MNVIERAREWMELEYNPRGYFTTPREIITDLMGELTGYEDVKLRMLELEAQLTAAQGEVEHWKKLSHEDYWTQVKKLEYDLSRCQAELQTYRDGVRVEGTIYPNSIENLSRTDMDYIFESGQRVTVLVIKEGE